MSLPFAPKLSHSLVPCHFADVSNFSSLPALSGIGRSEASRSLCSLSQPQDTHTNHTPKKPLPMHQRTAGEWASDFAAQRPSTAGMYKGFSQSIASRPLTPNPLLFLICRHSKLSFRLCYYFVQFKGVPKNFVVLVQSNTKAMGKVIAIVSNSNYKC